MTLLIASAHGVFAEEEEAIDPCSFGGKLRQQMGYRIYDSRQLSKMRTIVAPRASCDVNEDLSIHSEYRFWYDGVYDLTNGYSSSAEDELETDSQIRELYVDYSFGDFDLRAGQVQTVWGETIGLYVADIVNAKDYREFVLPDLNEINLPEPTIDLTYTKGDWQAQLIWIPYPRFNKLPPPGSEYEFTAGVVPPNSIANSNNEPGHSLDNSQFGTRFGYLVDDWDLGAFYLRTWDKSPVYERRYQGNVMSIVPTYKQVNVFGATVSKEISDTVWRGEVVLNQGGKYTTVDPNDVDGLKDGRQLSYAIGNDFRITDDTRANLQVIQQILLDYDNTYATIADEHETYLTAQINSELPEWSMIPEVVFLTSPNFDEGMVRPKISYKINQNNVVSAGVDWFYGKKKELFGEFSRRSRMHLEYASDF